MLPSLRNGGPLVQPRKTLSLALQKACGVNVACSPSLAGELQKCRIDPGHAAYDEAHALRAFCEILKFAPDEFMFAQGLLSDENLDHLKRKFSRENFQSDSEWFGAIQSEVTSVLLPEAERSVDSAEVLTARDAAFFSQEVVKNELAVDERIEAMIDRAVKRLVQAKAVKQMLGTNSPNERSGQPKRLPSNKPDGSQKVVTKKQNGRRSDSTREAAEREP